MRRGGDDSTGKNGTMPPSQRPDGSMRPARRVRPGFIPAAEMPKYKPPPSRQAEGSLGGAMVSSAFANACSSKAHFKNKPSATEPQAKLYVTRPYTGKFPSQMNDEELGSWLKSKSWLRPYQ